MTDNAQLTELTWVFHPTNDADMLQKKTLLKLDNGSTFEISDANTTESQEFNLSELDVSESMWRSYKDAFLGITPPRGVKATQGLEMNTGEAVDAIMDTKKLRDKLRKHMGWSRVSRKRVQELVKDPDKIKEALDIIVAAPEETE